MVKVERLRFRVRKGEPLRKRTPVYAGLARTAPGHKIIGFYVRLGERCFGLTVH